MTLSSEDGDGSEASGTVRHESEDERASEASDILRVEEAFAEATAAPSLSPTNPESGGAVAIADSETNFREAEVLILIGSLAEAEIEIGLARSVSSLRDADTDAALLRGGATVEIRELKREMCEIESLLVVHAESEKERRALEPQLGAALQERDNLRMELMYSAREVCCGRYPTPECALLTGSQLTTHNSQLTAHCLLLALHYLLATHCLLTTS